MNVRRLESASAWFEVLQTTARSQTAVMNLAPGAESGSRAEAHPASDQVLLVLAGEVEAEVAGERAPLRAGEVVLIPAGTPHRFRNRSGAEVRTFSVYAGPAYPAGTEG